MEFCWRVESTTGRVMEDSEWHHHCGGEWPERARVAAVALVAVARRGEGSLGIRLLTDIRTVFGARDIMRTRDLLNMEELVWADLKGNPMTDRGLAHRLQPYDIVSKTIRDGNWIGRGYARQDFYDSWERYLSQPTPPAATATSATNATSAATNGHDMGHGERVALMMKHNGLTREQAEAEAAEWN